MSTPEERYDDMLDELYGDVEIAGLTYSTSRALKEIDPTAYRVGFADWEDDNVCEECGAETNGEWLCDDCAEETEENEREGDSE